MGDGRNQGPATGPAAPDVARPASFGAFWPVYLSAHRRPGNRALHVLGTLSGVTMLAAAAVLAEPWLVLAAPVVGYAFAWSGHYFVEGNRPATFGHPFWSLAADFRMTALILAGRPPPIGENPER